jgi:hypothetical protein
MATMICCICGDEITWTDEGALHIILSNMWLEDVVDARQQLWAHSYCFSAILNPSIPFDPEVLTDSE